MKPRKPFLLRMMFLVWCSAFTVAPSPVWAQVDQPSSEQQQFVLGLKKQMPDLEVVWRGKLRTPIQIKGILSEPLALDRNKIVGYFVEKFGALYSITSPESQITAGEIRTDSKGVSQLSLYQKHNNIPVYGVSLRLRLDASKRLQSAYGKWISGIDLATEPKLDRKKALDSILAFVREKNTGLIPGPKIPDLKPDVFQLVIFNPVIYGEQTSKNYLAYHVIVGTRVFFVDANTGQMLHTYSNIQRARSRNTHNSNDCFSLPGTLIIQESGPVGGAIPDAQTQNAHNFAGQVYDYFFTTHGRDSYDGNGSNIVSTVHSGVPLDLISLLVCCLFNAPCCGCLEANAAWIPPLNQMVYGDGGTLDDGRAFNPFTDALDVVAHEITHGVTQHSVFDISGNPVGLDYTGQSGALNESFSDVFAAMVDREDWLLGEDLVTAGYPAGAMRNLADPTNGGAYNSADPTGSARAGHQPDHMDNYVTGGDVHINSGIPNKVAYLMAAGGTHPRSGVKVKAIGRERTEKILYDVLTTRLNQTATFLEYRAAAQEAVAELYSGSKKSQVTVWNAFVACGICDPSIENHCKPKAYPFYWWDIFSLIFSRSSDDTALFREYRDQYLARTERGKDYTATLYANSEKALMVLTEHPGLILDLKEVMEPMRDGVLQVLKGREAVINQTDQLVVFLEKFALASPPELAALSREIAEQLIVSRREGRAFLGFRFN